MIVADCMTPDPLVVSKRESVQRLVELIHHYRIRQVPVVDEANRLVGIVTDRDIRSAVGSDDPKKLKLVAENLMTADVVTIIPGANLLDAVKLLHHHSFGALPVVVGDHVVGILSTHDLLRHMKGMLEEEETVSMPSRSLATHTADAPAPAAAYALKPTMARHCA